MGGKGERENGEVKVRSSEGRCKNSRVHWNSFTARLWSSLINDTMPCRGGGGGEEEDIGEREVEKEEPEKKRE